MTSLSSSPSSADYYATEKLVPAKEALVYNSTLYCLLQQTENDTTGEGEPHHAALFASDYHLQVTEWDIAGIVFLISSNLFMLPAIYITTKHGPHFYLEAALYTVTMLASMVINTHY